MSELLQRVADLSPTKRKLLELQLEQSRAPVGLAQPITKRADRTSAPASFAQERLWFLYQLEPNHSFYNVPRVKHLAGPLAVDALELALREIVSRHEALRTNFVLVGESLRQVINEHPNVTLSIVDLGDLPENQRAEAVARLTKQEAERPFDLSTDPTIRTTLLRLNDDEHILSLVTHHIASDAWSASILFSELEQLYEAFVNGKASPLQPLTVQYPDFAEWQRERLNGPTLARQLSYWKEKLAGAPLVLDLPTDHPRPPAQTFRGSHRSLSLPRALSDQLNSLSRQEGATLFMTLLAVFQVLLSRYCRQNDIVVGSPISGRTTPEIEGLIGFFVNTLVLRTNLSTNQTFRELLAQVRNTALEAYENQDLPFEKLVEEIEPQRDLGRNPIFQVMFQLQNTPRTISALEGLTVRTFHVPWQSVKFDLFLLATEVDGSLTLSMEYSTDLFNDATIERMLGHYENLLKSVVANPNVLVSKAPLLTVLEEQQIIVNWNDTRAPFFQDLCLHGMFEEQARKNAERVAIIYKDERLTYGELNARANQLAHYLQKLGVGPEVLVGICVDRSLEMLVGLLGILKAGGAYVPLDPLYPKDRLAFMLEDANARLLLTQQSSLKHLPETHAEVVCLDSDWPEVSKQSEENPLTMPAPQNLAYVIYTSGSTGKPKGVAIEHCSVAALLAWARGVFFQEELGGVLASTSICFDLSIFELFVPLSFGGKVLLADEALHLLSLPSANEVKLINTVPSAIVELLRLGGLPESVQTVNLAGEPLPASLVEKIYKQPQIKRVFDLYGPSEDTTYSTCALRLSNGPATIGRPISNTRIYLLDANLQPVPIGVPGELYIGGAGLARGYLSRPGLTANAFIPDPFSGERGTRIYKTGDLARYLADGNIEYLGRVDNQVKLRGFRIELGEIEGVIKKNPRVSEAIVLAREDNPADKRLVAYVIPNRDTSDSDLIKNFQAEQVFEWQAVWNETYVARVEDPTFNIVGWNNSYTDKPIPGEEMREWVDRTVDRILSLRPGRVLEIGCGTGLLLFRIAPHCTHYNGTDLSKTALDYLGQQLSGAQREFRNVTLTEQTADDFTGIDAADFDTVILNSVVQYFPSVDYLVRVLERAVKCLKPGGTIFLGDLRKLQLLRVLHTSVQLHTSPSSLQLTEVQRRVQERITQEKELVIDPAFFTALRRHLPEISQVNIQLKRGRYHNELTKFRYDVVLRVGTEPAHRIDPPWLDWRMDQLNLADVRQLLKETRPDILAIRGVPDARLASDFKALTLLGSQAGMQTAGELREALQKDKFEQGVEPEDFWALSKELPYDVELTGSLVPDGTFDAILRQRSVPYTEVVSEQGRKVDSSWSKYANDPLLGRVAQKLQPELISLLTKQLPEYMTPSEFIFLNAFPLTPNGKIDRSALPAPGQSRPQLEQPYVAPRSRVEKELANIWAEVLRRETVGVKDNFFQLGGHSLLATQVISRVRDLFKINFPLRRLFEFPTISELADAIAQAQREGNANSETPIKGKQRDGAALMENISSLSAKQIDDLLSEVLTEVNGNQ